MGDQSAWWARYGEWQAQCLREYNERYNETRIYFECPDPEPDNYEPGQLVEFGENGTAYPHGSGGINYINGAVTPWKEGDE